MLTPKPRAGDKSVDPFTGFALIALFKATPDEMAVLAAVWYLHLTRAPEDEAARGLDALGAVLCTPDPDERQAQAEAEADLPLDQRTPARPRMSRRQLERAVAKLKKRGWLKTDRAFQGRMAFYPTTPRFTFAEALSLYKSATLADLGLTSSPDGRSIPATVAAPNIQEIDRTNRQPTPQGSQAPQIPEGPSAGQLQARVTAILKAYAETWASLHPGAGSYIKHVADRKLAMPLAEAGVEPEEVGRRLKVWAAKADEYARRRFLPFWLFVRAFNELAPPEAPAAGTTAPSPRMPTL